MNAGKININGIFNGARKLEVPFYQRAYVWGEEQWERLLEDLAFITMTNRTYFIGSIILKQAKVNTWEVASDKKIVVDGQQRLTTMMLFYKAFCLLTNTTDKFDDLFKLEDGSFALNLGLNDEQSFLAVMNQDKPEEIVGSKSVSNIIPAFNYFIKNIEKEKYNRIRINQNLLFVCIDLDEGEDEQQVFDTINSLGVRLTTAELLKNYFYSKEDIELYKKNWVEVFEKDDDVRAYWNQEFEAGRVTRSMIDLFFDSYFQLFVQDTKYKVSTEDKLVYGRLDHLAQSYQDFIKKYCENKQTILDSMAEYANRFREIFDPSILNRQISKESFIQRINVVIFGLKNTTLIPYILYVAMNSSDEEFNSILLILESYIMRRIVTKATTKNYNNLYSSLILNKIVSSNDLLEALKKYGDATTYVPSDADLKDGFNNSKLTNLQAKGVIYFIEANLRTSKDALALLGFNQYSLEHLMPRKWRNHWNPCETVELARNRDNKLATLGNFAIITQALNTSISDSNWTMKKAGNKGNPGLDQCAAGLLTMNNVLSEDEWNESKIEARAAWLYDKASNIWNSVLPAVVEGGGYVDKSGNSAELRRRFWSYALPLIKESNNKTGAYLNCNPTRVNEIWGSFGINACRVGCIANYDKAYIWFYLGKKEKEKNKELFDLLYSHKDEIHEKLGVDLEWSRADQFIASWITYELPHVSVGNEQDWPKIAKFLAEWSSKISEAMLCYLIDDGSDLSTFFKVSESTREWAARRNDINYKIDNCSRSYTRFTTGAMSKILPDLKNAPSSWNTDNHYFYEIYISTQGDVQMQLSINSKNITDEFRTICDEIQRHYPSGSKVDWMYRIPFKTKKINHAELDKEKLLSYLDSCMEQVHAFESDLQEKLQSSC